MNTVIEQLQIEIEKVEKSLSRAMYLKDNEAIDDYAEELSVLKKELKDCIRINEN